MDYFDPNRPEGLNTVTFVDSFVLSLFKPIGM